VVLLCRPNIATALRCVNPELAARNSPTASAGPRADAPFGKTTGQMLRLPEVARLWNNKAQLGVTEVRHRFLFFSLFFSFRPMNGRGSCGV
jgi:hypothetical protein